MKSHLLLYNFFLSALLSAGVGLSPLDDPITEAFSPIEEALPVLLYYPSPYPPTASAAIQLNTTSSPILAVSPINSKCIVAVMNQDPMLTCYMAKDGSLQFVRVRFQEVAVSTSTDGGTTWQSGNMPLSVVLGGSISDGLEVSQLRYASSGKTLFSCGRFSDLRPSIANRKSPASGIWAARSTDDGASWKPYVVSTQASEALEDFLGTCDGTPDIACDLSDDQKACLVWDRPHYASIGDYGDTQALYGNLYCSQTTDAGASWTQPTTIYDMQQNGRACAVSMIQVPDKTILSSFMRIQNAQNQYPTCDRVVLNSPDFGSSWAKNPIVVSSFVYAQEYNPVLHVPRNFTYPPLDGSEKAHMAVSEKTGHIYLIWQAGSLASNKVKTQSQHPEIVLSVSSDKGKSWSKPIAISQTYAALSKAKIEPLKTPAYQAFNGNIAWLGKDLLGLIYYDHRNYIQNQSIGATDAWLAVFRETSHAGSTKVGLDFVKEYRLTANSFDSSNVQSDSFMTAGLGNTLGIAAANDSFAVSYAQVGEIVSSPLSQCSQSFCAHIDKSQRLTCFFKQVSRP